MHETLRRTLWFVAFWIGGIATLAVVAFAIRMMIS